MNVFKEIEWNVKNKKRNAGKKKKRNEERRAEFFPWELCEAKEKERKKDKANVPIAHSRWIRSVAGVAADWREYWGCLPAAIVRVLVRKWPVSSKHPMAAQKRSKRKMNFFLTRKSKETLLKHTHSQTYTFCFLCGKTAGKLIQNESDFHVIAQKHAHKNKQGKQKWFLFVFSKPTVRRERSDCVASPQVTWLNCCLYILKNPVEWRKLGKKKGEGKNSEGLYDSSCRKSKKKKKKRSSGHFPLAPPDTAGRHSNSGAPGFFFLSSSSPLKFFF